MLIWKEILIWSMQQILKKYYAVKYEMAWDTVKIKQGIKILICITY